MGGFVHLIIKNINLFKVNCMYSTVDCCLRRRIEVLHITFSCIILDDFRNYVYRFNCQGINFGVKIYENIYRQVKILRDKLRC